MDEPEFAVDVIAVEAPDPKAGEGLIGERVAGIADGGGQLGDVPEDAGGFLSGPLVRVPGHDQAHHEVWSPGLGHEVRLPTRKIAGTRRASRRE